MNRRPKRPSSDARYILTKDDHIVWVSECDFAAIKKFPWRVNPDGYAFTTIKGRKVLMHRMILRAADGVIIDHANHDRLDNRRSNLRAASYTQNNANSHRPRKNSPFRGVRKQSNGSSWGACIKIAGKRYHLGSYSDPAFAAKVYDAAARHLYQEFALVNFADIDPDAQREAHKWLENHSVKQRENNAPYRGVWSAPHGRWRAVVYHAGRRVSMSGFTTPEAAAQARNNYIVQHGLSLPLCDIRG